MPETWGRLSSRSITGSRAKRELVGMLVAAVAEVGPGVRGGDAVEGGAERPVQGVLVPRRDAAQLGLHPGPRRLDRAQVRRVGRQVAVREAGAVEQLPHL